mmetsp:Transcript_117459/g.336993  ORF Transcript_117459/g.336993 Transcript_117459/m.336993 type:complete len:205 (+) Transcript_117459:1128-1742(+)
MALVEKVLHLSDPLRAQFPSSSMHRLERIKQGGFPIEHHVVVPVDRPPTGQDHEPLPRHVQVEKVAEKLGLEEGTPHPVQTVCRVEHEHYEKHPIGQHAEIPVEELEEIALEVALVIHTACLAEPECHGQLLQTIAAQLRIHKVHPDLDDFGLVVDPAPLMVVPEPVADLFPSLRRVQPKMKGVVHLLIRSPWERGSQLGPPKV